MSPKLIIATLLIFSIFFCGLPNVNACGPFSVDPMFSFTRHGDFPIGDYAGGNVGIVPASFGRMSLFVFYRELNGLKLSKSEREQVTQALKHRIENNASREDETSTDKQPEYLNRWYELRRKITNQPVQVATEKEAEYLTFKNCPRNAIDTASKTLESRLSKYGNNADLKDWLAGQDAVFSNCAVIGKVPAAASGNSPDWLQIDRTYQIAAAKFYAGDETAAREGFSQIAKDEKSPWKNISNYLIARTYIRQASFLNVSDYPSTDAEKVENEKKKAERTNLLQQAEKQLNSIISDSSMQEFQTDAKMLLNLVKYRLRPLERQNELARSLVQKSENPNIYNDLTDYIWLLDKNEQTAHDKGYEAESKRAEAAGKEPNWNYKFRREDFSPEELANEMSDWLFNYQMEAKDSFAYSYSRWKSTRSLAWFVAAIAKARKDAPEADQMISGADDIKSDSPAFATVRFHQIRLLLEQNKRAEARKKLTDVNLDSFQTSTKNKFLAQKMILAETLEDFIKNAQRKSAAFVWSDDANENADDSNKEFDSWKARTMFDQDSANFINTKLPLSKMRELALNNMYPEHLKRSLINAVWTRAIILGNSPIEKEFTPLMQKYRKEFEPFLSRYANAKTPADKEAHRLLLLLRIGYNNPAIRSGPDDAIQSPTSIYTGQWWCNEKPRTEDSEGFEVVSPAFISAGEMNSAQIEQKKMQNAGESATFLAKRAIAFANEYPANADIPEILHLAVRSTRYACQDKQTLGFSKQAFDILRKKYPANAWTKKTPYFYGIRDE